MKNYLFVLLLIISITTFSQTKIGIDIDGEEIGDQSGISVSLSFDGSIVAIGAVNNNGNGENSGHVRVYENISGNWIQIGSDIDGEATYDFSGNSVSLSSDGSIVAIGAVNNNGSGSGSGHVRVYENILGNWVQIGSDINGEAAGDTSGISVSLSSDGSIVAIGAFNNDGSGSGSGHVRIYQYILERWIQIGLDIDGEAAGDQSGWSVSLSSNGSIVAIGSINNNGNGVNSGHVRIYENISGNWVQIGSDIDGEVANDSLGWSISLSSNGNIIAIGAVGVDENGINSGHVRVYENISGNWIQIGTDINGEGSYDFSGRSVSLSSDGSVVAIGAQQNNGNGENSGHVRIYQYILGNWVQIGLDIDGEAEDDLSGRSISLSSNGKTVAIGATNNDDNGQDSGHVRVYDLSAVLSSNSFTLSQFKIYPNPTKNQFTIQLQEGIQLEKVSIYNQLGQFISSTKTNYMDTKNISQGIYFVEVITNKGKSTKKLIIE